MHWIITEDHINKDTADDPSKVGKMRANRHWMECYRAAPAEAKPPMIEGFKQVMTEEFRLYDDDGNLYYVGLCKDLDDQEADSAFQPLDWAMNDVGAVRMDYRKIGATEWKTL